MFKTLEEIIEEIEEYGRLKAEYTELHEAYRRLVGCKNKIRSIKLCLMAHPDNEPNSEFADRITDLEEIESKMDKL